MALAPHPFPRGRFVAAAWLLVWTPAYALTWGAGNFLALCDVAVILGCLGFITGRPLLLSTQALITILPGGAWAADVIARLATGKHLLGGTEYFFDERFALPVRLLSLFHVVLPVALVYGVRHAGYDRRALWVQSALTTVLIIAARFLVPDRNLNFARTDPFLHRAFEPWAWHVFLIAAFTFILVLLPTHALLARIGGGARRSPATPPNPGDRTDSPTS